MVIDAIGSKLYREPTIKLLPLLYDRGSVNIVLQPLPFFLIHALLYLNSYYIINNSTNKKSIRKLVKRQTHC